MTHGASGRETGYADFLYSIIDNDFVFRPNDAGKDAQVCLRRVSSSNCVRVQSSDVHRCICLYSYACIHLLLREKTIHVRTS